MMRARTTPINPPKMALFSCIAGTLIRTPAGDIAVEDFLPGDLICTADHGPQPLRHLRPSCVEALGDRAPVCIRAGTLGPHATLFVAQEHRILIRDSLAALLFGAPEVLVAARDLVNGRSVTLMQGGLVDYVELGFDTPQVIFAHGLATASFEPAASSHCRLLRPFEAQVLMTAAA
jgi:Hint domain